MTQTWNICNEEGLKLAIEQLTSCLRDNRGLTITLSADIPDTESKDAQQDPEEDYPWRSCMAYE